MGLSRACLGGLSRAFNCFLWRRVPTDHVTVLPNIFIVRDVDPDNAKDFLFSANMYRIAKANGWWKEGEALDFTATFSNGEYGHKYYSGRRTASSRPRWA